MYCLSTEQSFDSAHFLAGYEGKCSNIHGHRWRVVAEIESEELEEAGQLRGMVVDFSRLKADLKEIVTCFDHTLIIEKNTLKPGTKEALEEENFRIVEVDFRPTAENFSRYFFVRLKEDGYPIHKITVYETPNNCASYSQQKEG